MSCQESESGSDTFGVRITQGIHAHISQFDGALAAAVHEDIA